MKTILIFNGSCKKGQETIAQMLSENDLTNNVINNRVICVDKPENANALQKFSDVKEFTFIAAQSGAPIDLDQKVDLCLFATDESK